MSPQQSKISVIDPIDPAIGRVRAMLFRPFDLGRWFVIGFCAWLAYLGTGGSPRLNIPSKQEFHDLQAEQIFDKAKDFVIENLPWIILGGLLVLAVAITVWLLITWLSSRGRFMFLHCVAHNKAEVAVPWRKFHRHANSLFLFRIVLDLIGVALFAVPCILGVIVATTIAASTDLKMVAIIGILIGVLILFVISIALFLVHKFTRDFVVPIMFLRTPSCTAAWREFLTILSANIARFFLYILFQIVIAIAISVIILAAVCVTCCCAACILAIPYIGTVAILPLAVFKRAYSVYYLRQFGPQFDVFTSEAVTA